MYIVVFKLFNIIIFNIAKSALHLEKMKPTLTFTRDSKNTKKPLHMKNGVFLIYAPRKIETLLCNSQETTQWSQLIYLKTTGVTLLQNSGMTE